MIDLTKTTFIIPIMIESNDRFRNFLMLLSYLNKHFTTNIIIYEIILYNKSIIEEKISDFKNLNIKIIYDKNNNVFHRTKYLNIMLNMVDTPVVVNYDIDVLLPIESYINAQNIILNNEADVIYPYNTIKNTKYRINLLNLNNISYFLENPDLKNLNYDGINYSNTIVGFCIFFNTNVYKSGGGENENFISWGPEDRERYFRFKTLGYKIINFENGNLYHLNHIRTNNSNKTNIHFTNNLNLFNEISMMNKEQLLNYLNKQDYLNNYDFKKK